MEQTHKAEPLIKGGRFVCRTCGYGIARRRHGRGFVWFHWNINGLIRGAREAR